MESQLATRTAVRLRRSAHALALATATSTALAALFLLRAGLVTHAGMPRPVVYATTCVLLAGAATAAATAVRIRRIEAGSPYLAVVTVYHLVLLYYCVRILGSS